MKTVTKKKESCEWNLHRYYLSDELFLQRHKIKETGLNNAMILAYKWCAYLFFIEFRCQGKRHHKEIKIHKSNYFDVKIQVLRNLITFLQDQICHTREAWGNNILITFLKPHSFVNKKRVFLNFLIKLFWKIPYFLFIIFYKASELPICSFQYGLAPHPAYGVFCQKKYIYIWVNYFSGLQNYLWAWI